MSSNDKDYLMATGSFTKLFSSITASTIWCEPNHVRIVWITMLAMADRNGDVAASIPGLADISRVKLEECEDAIGRFLKPDKYSRNKSHEGRRIEEIPGGWRLLNYEYYREIQNAEARKEAKRKWWHENKGLDSTRQTRPRSTQAEAEAEADLKSNTLSGKPDPAPPKAEKPEPLTAQAREVLVFLNEKTGKNYQPVSANLDLIVARLKEGYSVQDLRTLTARKIMEWEHDDKMAKFLRPKTLYNKTNAAQYLGECVA